MEFYKKNIEFILDGFFYFFGFTDNPAKDKVKPIIEDHPSEKIKSDLKRINNDYRKQYIQMRKEALCLE